MSPSALDHLGSVTPHTRAKAALALSFLQSRGYQPTHFWGYDPNAANAEHHAGTAVDFMVFSSAWAGDALADWLWANRKLFGLKHEIWKQRIRSTVVQPGVWRMMPDRGSPTDNHMDHVHGMFYNTPAMGDTEGDPAQPRVKVNGIRNEETYLALQAYLNREAGATLAVDGDFGKLTIKAVERWVGGSVTGSMSAADVKGFQRKIHAAETGSWDASTTMSLQRFLNNHPGRP